MRTSDTAPNARPVAYSKADTLANAVRDSCTPAPFGRTNPATLRTNSNRPVPIESAAEIDDIDLENTLDSTVTVVEWGRGRVEHLSDSLLDVELHRPLVSPPDSEDGVLDFDTDDDDEPRTIVLRGFGPRWVNPPVLPAPAETLLPGPHTPEGN